MSKPPGTSGWSLTNDSNICWPRAYQFIVCTGCSIPTGIPVSLTGDCIDTIEGKSIKLSPYPFCTQRCWCSPSAPRQWFIWALSSSWPCCDGVWIAFSCKKRRATLWNAWKSLWYLAISTEQWVADSIEFMNACKMSRSLVFPCSMTLQKITMKGTNGEERISLLFYS